MEKLDIIAISPNTTNTVAVSINKDPNDGQHINCPVECWGLTTDGDVIGLVRDGDAKFLCPVSKWIEFKEYGTKK